MPTATSHHSPNSHRRRTCGRQPYNFELKIKPLTQPLRYDCHDIHLVNQHKILGVIFLEHLSWNQHVTNICNKSALTGSLTRCRRILPMKVNKLQIYKALFLFHVNYCSLGWATTMKADITKLECPQKKIIRQVENRLLNRNRHSENTIVKLQH